MNLTRRHVLKRGDQWFSIGLRFEDEDGWIDVDSKYFGKTVAEIDPNNLHSFRRNNEKDKLKEVDKEVMKDGEEIQVR